ncbi:hypothetical protein [Brevibacillus borstelensis]|uniref:DedA family protein n=1 Tax=Brevibacillus borstelensis TaxID=45462 RepID=UPI0030EB26D7
MLSAFLGATAGITISYFIGNKLGLPFFKKVEPELHIADQKIERTDRLFQTFGPYLLLFGYFIPGVRTFNGLPCRDVAHGLSPICPLCILRRVSVESHVSVIGLFSRRKVVYCRSIHPPVRPLRPSSFGIDHGNSSHLVKIQTG